jgi:fatty acid-binding protein DegV
MPSINVNLPQTEQNSSGAFLPIAVKSASEEIVYLHLDSRLSVDLLEEVQPVLVL